MIKDSERNTLIVGQMYGNVRVIEYAGYEISYEKCGKDEPYERKNHYWKVECSICGCTKLMKEKNIRVNPKSCGCNRTVGLINRSRGLSDGSIRPASGEDNGMYKHGESNSKLHHVWKDIRYRCSNPKNSSYKYYGAKGITVCEEWNDPKIGYANFSKWAKDNGYTEDEHCSIQRVNNDKGYNPDNCFISSTDHKTNESSYNTMINWDGFDYSLTELCQRFGQKKSKVSNRIYEGKTLEEAVLAKDWTPGWEGKAERDDYVANHGPYRQHPENVTAFVFTDYPEISTVDPSLQTLSRERIAEIRGLIKAPQETEEEYQRAREAAKQSLIENLKNQKTEE